MEDGDEVCRTRPAGHWAQPGVHLGDTEVVSTSISRAASDSLITDEDAHAVSSPTRVTELIEGGQLAKAQQELVRALALSGESAELLRRLAEVEGLRDQDEAAISHFARAVALEPRNPTVLSAYADFLSNIGLQRQALDFLAEIPADIAKNSLVRTALGDIYSAAGWHAFAVDAYGDAGDLSAEAKRARRRSWRRSGGPLAFVRRRLRQLDSEARATWRRFSESLVVLDSLDRPQGFEALRVRAEVDAFLQRWALLLEWWEAVRDWVRRCTRVVIIGVTWLVLFEVAQLLRPRAATWAIAVASIASTALAWLVWRIFVNFANSISLRNSMVLGILGGAFCAGGGLLLAGEVAAPPAWPGIVGVALVAAPCMAGCMFVAINSVGFLFFAKLRTMRRRKPRAAILYYLLELLQGLEKSQARNDLDARSGWIWLLELAARRMETDLPAAFDVSDAETYVWVTARADGAAAALRRMKRHIAAPRADSWDRLVSALRGEVSALATGDLAALRWAPPVAPEARRKRTWQMVFLVVRTVVLMAVPILAILALQPILKLDSQIFAWAKAVTLGWAVLYLLITIDPTLNDKIETARNLIDATPEKNPQRPKVGE